MANRTLLCDVVDAQYQDNSDQEEEAYKGWVKLVLKDRDTGKNFTMKLTEEALGTEFSLENATHIIKFAEALRHREEPVRVVADPDTDQDLSLEAATANPADELDALNSVESNFSYRKDEARTASFGINDMEIPENE